MRVPNEKAPDVLRHGIVPFSHDRLMEISERRLSLAAQCGSEAEKLVAMRVFDNPRDFSHWECRHAQILKRIVEARKLGPQRCILLSTSLQLIHQKALFEYLRVSRVRGEQRVLLMRTFFPHSDYRASVISEHNRYIRSAASLMCSSHIGARVMLDDIFEQPLMEYEALYSEYFRVYCEWIGGTSKADAAAAEAQVCEMKQQVCSWHRSLLDLSYSRSGTWRRPAAFF